MSKEDRSARVAEIRKATQRVREEKYGRVAQAAQPKIDAEPRVAKGDQERRRAELRAIGKATGEQRYSRG